MESRVIINFILFLKIDTVVENVAEAVQRYHRSKDYESAKSSDEQGILKIKLGRVKLSIERLLFFKIYLKILNLKLNMGVEKLTENLGAAIDKIKSHKKYAMGNFFMRSKTLNYILIFNI